MIFISHKHADKGIADVVSDFITMQSGGRIKVFQSSSAWTDAPKAGRNLNQELREALWKARALILVYTTSDYNWDYCMWECGVATNPGSVDSKTIVFQCGGTVPKLYCDHVNVNARNPVDIQRFTNDFLTDPTFLPGSDGAISRFQPNGREVVRAATDFLQKLRGILPPEKVDPDDEWPAYPFIQFELSQAEVDRINKLKATERGRTAHEIIRNECVIGKADKYAEQLFGVPSFAPRMNVKQLADMWSDKHPNSKAEWLEGLCAQIMDGVMWRFPTPVWKFMQGMNGAAWYAPVMNRVRKIPSQQCLQFDVYFYKFNPDQAKSMSPDLSRDELG